MSDHARQVLAKTNLVVMSGLAGGGRNTVINRLVATGKYQFVVSDTTRPPKLRDGKMEQDGVHYNFRSEADFLRDLENGEFLEAEVIHNQQVSGISIRELDRARRTDRIAVNEIEFGGINAVAAAKSDVHVIGLLPPSYDEWLRRLLGREEIHEQELINRLHTAQKVLENMIEKPYFKIAINDNIDHCVGFIRRVVEDGQYSVQDADYGLAVARDILAGVQRRLSSM